MSFLFPLSREWQNGFSVETLAASAGCGKVCTSRAEEEMFEKFISCGTCHLGILRPGPGHICSKREPYRAYPLAHCIKQELNSSVTSCDKASPTLSQFVNMVTSSPSCITQVTGGHILVDLVEHYPNCAPLAPAGHI
jgi:hypothetical protein